MANRVNKNTGGCGCIFGIINTVLAVIVGICAAAVFGVYLIVIGVIIAGIALLLKLFSL
jgi:hypothetical protein